MEFRESLIQTANYMVKKGGGILAAINKGLDLAEQGEFKGLVIANEGANFSAGANVGMIFMMAADMVSTRL